jgi:16S rRNA (adenine1518-N6/adenine1519-N6)-dimethyltransferase
MYTLKKSLGQHFLKNEITCQNIVELLPNDVERLLEIGPGAGAITKYLLQIPNIDFKAIEIDEEKHQYLNQTYPAIQGKILNIDFLKATAPFNTSFWVIGNFPYNISTEIVFKILEWKDLVQGVVGMFQKEVAERLAAKPGSKIYGVTSVLTQAYYAIEYQFDVLPEDFNPPPKVMSGVIKMLPLETPLVQEQDAKRFKQIVKTAFQQRRKTLRNSVKPLFNTTILSNELFNLRPEQLSVQQFVELAKLSHHD